MVSKPRNRTTLLDHGYIEVIETWGNDERIIEAARMSTDKGFLGWGPVHDESCTARWNFLSDRPKTDCTCEPKQGDEKLLRYLYEHHHATPFEMAGLIIEVQAPIFVFREWHRHRTQSYNELSARYTTLPDLLYIPSIERLMFGGQSHTNKQSSGNNIGISTAAELQEALSDHYKGCRAIYETLLSIGVAREIARIVIPVAQYSRMRASANLRNWLAFLTLRMAPGAQFEIRQYANAVANILRKEFPQTMKLFDESVPK